MTDRKSEIMEELAFFDHKEELRLQELVEISNKNGYYSKNIAERYLIAKDVFKWLKNNEKLKADKIKKAKELLYSNKNIDVVLFNQKERKNLLVFINVLKNTIHCRPFWVKCFTDIHKVHLPKIIQAL